MPAHDRHLPVGRGEILGGGLNRCLQRQMGESSFASSSRIRLSCITGNALHNSGILHALIHRTAAAKSEYRHESRPPSPQQSHFPQLSHSSDLRLTPSHSNNFHSYPFRALGGIADKAVADYGDVRLVGLEDLEVEFAENVCDCKVEF